MKKYIVRMVFRIVCGDGKHAAQFDEQFRMVMADDETEAMEKAQAIGIQEEIPFTNHAMQQVKWQFAGITEITEIKEMNDGTELFSRIIEEDDAERFMQNVKQRENALRSKHVQAVAKLITMNHNA